jgi:hypothetical protein
MENGKRSGGATKFRQEGCLPEPRPSSACLESRSWCGCCFFSSSSGCYRKEGIEKWLEGRGVLGRAAENCYSSMVAVDVSRCGADGVWCLGSMDCLRQDRCLLGSASCRTTVCCVLEWSSVGAVEEEELACRGMLLLLLLLLCALMPNGISGGAATGRDEPCTRSLLPCVPGRACLALPATGA